jgi:hypothetical protein
VAFLPRQDIPGEIERLQAPVELSRGVRASSRRKIGTRSERAAAATMNAFQSAPSAINSAACMAEGFSTKRETVRAPRPSLRPGTM